MDDDNVVHLFDARSAYPSAAGDSVSDVQDIMNRWADNAASLAKRQWDDVTASAAARKAASDNLRATMAEHLDTIARHRRTNDTEEPRPMKITKRTIDRAITIAAAAAAPLLPILIRHQVLSAADATDLGYTFAAVVASYHGGAAVQRKRTPPSIEKLTP